MKKEYHTISIYVITLCAVYRKGFFEYEEFHSLTDALPDYPKPVATFAYSTGWRREEILGLTWKQVDLKEGTVRLEPGETKNQEGRTLYLEPDLLDMLRRLHLGRRLGCPNVFHIHGRQIRDFRKSWEKACREAGVPGMLFHDFRRTAVRNMVRAGIPERVVMTISGHKTRAVFDRYNIVSQDDLKRAAEKRQAFNELQAEQAQLGHNFGHNPPSAQKKVVAFTATTS